MSRPTIKVRRRTYGSDRTIADITYRAIKGSEVSADVQITARRAPHTGRPTLEIASTTGPAPDLRCPVHVALAALADVEIEIEPDDVDPADSVSEPALQWVRDQIAAGNPWAWCQARVVATIGAARGESSWLCGCSYESEHAFRAAGGYFDDMRDEALTALLAAIRGPA